jgi:hypothetical protein
VKRRSPPSRLRPKAGTSRQKFDCLDLLTGDEALAVLRELLSSHPDLLPESRRAANALLATVSFTDIAKGVFDALLALDLEDLDAGPRAGGYVELSEAAWKAIEGAVRGDAVVRESCECLLSRSGPDPISGRFRCAERSSTVLL